MQLTNYKIYLKNQTKWKWNQNHWICYFLWLFSFIASGIVKEQRMDYQTVQFHLKCKKWKMKKHSRFTQKALFSFWPNNIHLTLCFICINIFDTNVWSNARLQIKQLTFSEFSMDWLIKRLPCLSCFANPTISSVRSSWSFLSEKKSTNLQAHNLEEQIKLIFKFPKALALKSVPKSQVKQLQKRFEYGYQIRIHIPIVPIT